MGRRRRRVIRIVKKKLPTVFVCPRCGEEAVRVTIAKDTGHATVLCALCNLKDDFPAHPAAQAIDVYSYFTDRFYGVKDARPIIPHEREIFSAPAEEAEVEEQLTPPEVPKNEVSIENPQPTVTVEEPTSGPQVNITEQSKSPAQESPEKEGTATEAVNPPSLEEEKEKEDDSEPFADILDTPRDKKRYSPNPLPQQPPEQTS
ncbi:MAG TPA: transcription elongation factor 1 family protein [Candidatus Angelobacter sp.]|nr:transcription elongation factor 1 family protein [Candidatus Angelobacter sp.]